MKLINNFFHQDKVVQNKLFVEDLTYLEPTAYSRISHFLPAGFPPPALSAAAAASSSASFSAMASARRLRSAMASSSELSSSGSY